MSSVQFVKVVGRIGTCSRVTDYGQLVTIIFTSVFRFLSALSQ